MIMASLIQTTIVFVHLMFAVFALYYVISADIKILKGEFFNENEKLLAEIGDRLTHLLLGLWASGLMLVLIDLKLDLSIAALSAKPKLIVKLICVAVLTLNAGLLHVKVFPQLLDKQSISKREWILISVAGGMSAVSWLMAAFLGVAKPMAKEWTVINFFSLYALALAGGMLAAYLASEKLQEQFERKLAALAPPDPVEEVITLLNEYVGQPARRVVLEHFADNDGRINKNVFSIISDMSSQIECMTRAKRLQCAQQFNFV